MHELTVQKAACGNQCILGNGEHSDNVVEAQNGLSKHEEKTMTVKEVAEVLGVSRELITKRIRELFPEKMQRGSTTYLNEAEVTVIKKRIEQNAHLATSYDHTKLVDMPKTNLEKQLLIRQAMQIQNEMIAELESENEKLKTEVEAQKPKAEYYDALIERGNCTNIRNTAKELNIPEKKFVKMLLVDGVLYRDKKGQLAHRIPKTKYNVRTYGKRIINHPMNLRLTCSLKCNAAVLIDGKPIEKEQLLHAINIQIHNTKGA